MPGFADRARILVAGGAGGDGASTFRREAHVPRGGPDGGDGGNGGSVILVVEPGMTTLGDFKRRRHFRAAAGGRGMGRKAHGRNAPDVIVRVLSLLAEPSTAPADLEETLRNDPVLVARILGLVGSPLYGRRHAARTVREAIVVLGFRGLRSVLMASASDRTGSLPRES